MKIESMHWLASLSAAAILASGLGCTPSTPAGGTGATGTANPAKTDDAHEHAHPAHGPHGGDLVELGNEEYHAEVVHSEKDAELIVYLLDSHAKKAVAVDATELVVNVTHEGKPEQFKLAAAPQADDPAGKSSKFTSKDAHLLEDVHDGKAAIVLKVVVEGKPFSGKIVHHHDHDHGDAHKDHDHKDHDHKREEKKPAAK